MATLSGLRKAAAAAAVALAAFAAGPGLGIGLAYADDERKVGAAGVPTVSFDGGSLLNLIVCRSEPSRSALTVPTGSRVIFVNWLGQDAVLRVDGRPVVRVGPGQAAPLVFRHGPVSVSMTFSCGAPVVEQFLATMVSVDAEKQHRPVADGPSRAVSAAPSQPVASAAAGSGTGAAAGSGTDTPVKASPSGFGHAALSPAGSAGRAPTAAPDRSAASTAGSLTVERSPAPAAAPVADTPSAAPPTGDDVVVEPLIRVASATRDTSSTLLASIAAIFVVGVTIAAIRVIILKRTIRTNCA